MWRISRVKIKRFRSIMNLDLSLQDHSHIVTFCGANNVGKTNILRAINLFFHPDALNSETDIPFQKSESGSGGARLPEISIEFKSGVDVIKITRKFVGLDEDELEGEKTVQNKFQHIDKAESIKFLDQFFCKFIEVINLSFPELIREVVNEVYDIEYEKSRFKGLKEQLRKAHEEYSDGLLKVLRGLAHEISPSFKEFNENWSVDFDLRDDIQKFRDLISDNVEFYIKDNSNKEISSKGSGLQRLAFILLQTRIAQKAMNKIPVLLIDEPDAFLHPFLEKQLNAFLKNTYKDKGQIFVTVHSPTFIDSFHLRNVFLLELDVGELFLFKKVNKYIKKIETVLVDVDSTDGSRKIKEHLGIDDCDLDLLDRYNIVVEGSADQKYVSELADFFEIKLPKIIPAHGVSNIEKNLYHYSSLYEKTEKRPSVLILLDDDDAGRATYRKLFSDKPKFAPLKIEIRLVPNHLGEVSSHEDVIKNISINKKSEIEDFIYPSLVCDLSNEILVAAKYNQIDTSQVCNKISKPAFKAQGILQIIEVEKNNSNPDTGQRISFSGSDRSSEKMKSNIANKFRIRANKKLIKEIAKLDTNFPLVQETLREWARIATQ